MSRHRRFCDGAGFTCHCLECDNSTDWHGEIGKCGQTGIIVGKYDSPNNGCSNAGGCGYYAQPQWLRGKESIKMDDFKTRMKEEYSELLGRIEALDAFIVANEEREGSNVSDAHYRMMQTQLHAMCAYEGALRMRIEDLGIALDVGKPTGDAE